MQCPTCSSLLPVGVLWCPICFGNVSFPQIGKLATPTRRLCAYLIDWTTTTIVGVAMGFGRTLEGEARTAAVLFVLAAYLVVLAAFLARGTTLGKRLLGLYVFKGDGKKAGFFRMFLREGIGKSISLGLLGLGALWIIWDKENRTWHDMLLKTHVVKVK